MSGIMERLRRFSGRSSEPQEPGQVASPKSPKEDPWRGVFDPNTNPGMKKVGRDYYDNVDDPKTAKTTWDYRLDSEKEKKEAVQDVTQAAFKAMGATSKQDTIDAAALRKLFDKERVDTIMKAADTKGDGMIDYTEFCSMLRKYPCE